jgi:hypothetical protein
MIIGIAGKAQAGKDTTAGMINFLREHPKASWNTYWNSDLPFDFEYNIVHFADLLKDVAEIMLSLPRFTMQGMAGKSMRFDWLDGMTGREFLQKFGTAVRNEVHPEFWTRALFIKEKDNQNLIIPDVRFPNEAQIIKDHGGMLIRIERPGAGAGNHISEIALDDYRGWDIVIDNVGTLEDLYNKVKFLMNDGQIK